MPAGAVDLGGFAKAASVGYSVEDAMAASIVRLECEADELRATVALLEAERDLLRVQFRAAEGLGMALVKTIGQLKEEKADLFVKLVNLQAGSRRSSLDEIAESVREKYEPEHEGEGMQNE
jgi:cell division protein FtsB